MVRTLASAVLVVAVPVLLAGCGDDAKGRPEAVPTQTSRPVVVETVAYKDEHTAPGYVAIIRPRTEVDLGFRVSGRVEKRLVDVGARVAAGQPLAILDTADLRLQLEQAEADLTSAKSTLVTAEAAEQRKIDLNARGWTAAASFEQQKAQTDEARGRVTRAARAVTLSRNALTYATLNADADGVVTATQIEPGQVVSAGQPAVRVARTAEKEALVAIPEARIQNVRGGSARLTLWAIPGQTFEARLRELSPTADTSTRTFAARFAIVGAPADLELGMTGTLTIATPDAHKIARLPLGALFNAGDGPAVWVVDGTAGAVVRRPVIVAGYDAAAVLVSSGVSDGEQVVALGVHKLDAGQKVRVVAQPGT